MLDNSFTNGDTAEMTMTKTRAPSANEGERQQIKSNYIMSLQVVKMLWRK